jgi:hypothetical protein
VGCAEERIARKHCIGPRTPAARSSVSRARNYKSVGRVSVFEDVLMRPPSSAAPTTKHGSCPKSGGPPLMSSVFAGYRGRMVALAAQLVRSHQFAVHSAQQHQRPCRAVSTPTMAGAQRRIKRAAKPPGLLASSEPPLGVTSAPALLQLSSLLMSTTMSLRKHRSAYC